MSANNKVAAALHPIQAAFIEYGVMTPGGSVLVVTDDYRDAEDALEWVQGGKLVTRSVTYGAWSVSR